MRVPSWFLRMVKKPRLLSACLAFTNPPHFWLWDADDGLEPSRLLSIGEVTFVLSLFAVGPDDDKGGLEAEEPVMAGGASAAFFTTIRCPWGFWATQPELCFGVCEGG